MKKNYIYYLFIFLISLFIGVSDASADVVMLVECPVNKRNKGSEKDEKWIFFRDPISDYKWSFYNGRTDKGLSGRFYPLDWCWNVNAEDINGWCDKHDNFGKKNGLNNQFEQEYCPTNHKETGEWGEARVLAGTTTAKHVVRLQKPQYLFVKDDEDNVIWMEYYDENGDYHILGNGKSYSKKGYLDFLYKLIDNNETRENFFELNEKTSYLLSLHEHESLGTGEPLDSLIYGTNLNRDNLVSYITTWYNNNKDKLNEQQEKHNDFKDTYGQLLNSCTVFNDKMESDDTYNTDYNKMLNELENALPALKGVYGSSTKFKLCSNNEDGFALNSAVNCILQDSLGNVNYAGDGFKIVARDFADIFSDEGIDLNSNLNSELSEDLTTLTKCISYLDANASDLGLDTKETSDLRWSYESYAEEKNIYVTIDCKGLLGQDLINKIKSYLNIIKIVIPIILIGFGVFDFAKAVFAGTDDNMKKAQQDFIKRLGIAILIFFIPVIVDLILGIANQVWTFISPDSCGLF